MCWTGPHCAQEDDDTYAEGKELGICQGSLGSRVYLDTRCTWDCWTSTPAFPFPLYDIYTRCYAHSTVIAYVLVTLTLSEGGIMLVKIWLIFTWGSSSTGFTLFYSYQCPSLEGQSPKQLTNQ